ncbi:hypothetical protein B0H11DRAFT_1911608 [Mycena galericulata]|nr:hypothetical protein B0H11DRAFT_1911608 [Mycena galericulata]
MTSEVEDRRERQTGDEANMVQRYPMIIPAVGLEDAAEVIARVTHVDGFVSVFCDQQDGGKRCQVKCNEIFEVGELEFPSNGPLSRQWCALVVHIDLTIWLWWRGDRSDGLARHAQFAGSFVLLPIEMTKESARRREASGEDDSKKVETGLESRDSEGAWEARGEFAGVLY